MRQKRLVRISAYAISILSAVYFILNSLMTRNLLHTKITADSPDNLETIDIACKLPKLDPYDSSIKKFLDDEIRPWNCHLDYPKVFALGLNHSVVREPNSSEWKDCCYRIIYRSTNKTNDKIDSEVRYSEECVPMLETVTEIPSQLEYIGIYCILPGRNDSSEKQFVDAFSFIPEKENLKHKTIQDDKDKLSVVILGLDSLSNMNFIRSFPQTRRFITQDLDAIIMDGYVNVGEMTYQNMIGALAAMTELTAQESCEKNKFFDDCPFVWKKFAREGYITSYGEDSPTIGMFNYLKNGFQQPPVDYYLRPISNVFSSETGYKCSGPRLALEFLLNYMKKLAIVMNRNMRRPYFQLIMSGSLTHDYINQGRIGDEIIADTFRWFKKQGYLNKTVLIVMSDHGLRNGDFRSTKQGHIEDNMPFVSYVFPGWFKQKYSTAIRNLKANKHRLTTAFDFHETLTDILNTTNLGDNQIKLRSEMLESQLNGFQTPRGISMFLPSPPKRTCGMAEIREHYCPCQHEGEKSEATDSSIVQQAANFAVHTLNSLLADFSGCAFLDLKEIKKAYSFNMTHIMPGSITEESLVSGVRVSFVSSPGKAEFEATVLRRSLINKTYSWTFSDISRTNLYGNQSHCVNDRKIKKFCYCTDLLQ